MRWACSRAAIFCAAVISLAACGGGGGGSSPATPSPPAPPTPVAPTITQPPVAVAVNEGDSASFAVTATGTAPITYQWRRNGQPIAGATQSSLALSATAFYDGGDRFSVVVSNAAGQATSTEAVLTVNIRPKLALCSTAYVVRADGTVWSWGSNAKFELGRGSTDPSNQPTPQAIPGLANAVSVACGSSHALALLRDGTVRGWGWNSNGQVGDGTRLDRASPVVVPGMSDVVAVTAGLQASYALKRDGTLWMWGISLTNSPVLSTPDPSASLTPVQMTAPEPLAAIAVLGSTLDSGLAIGRSGQLYYFGSDRRVDLAGVIDPVTSIPGIANAIGVAVGPSSAAVLRTDGSVWVWGRGTSGEFGNGQTTGAAFATAPRQVPGLPRITRFSYSSEHILAMDVDGRLWSWGGNGFGELGRVTNVNIGSQQATPAMLQAPLDVETFVAGSVANSMAMTRDGTIWAWGYNFNGTLGVPYNQVVGTATPILVSGVSGR
jgi:alpha-tubulin suppressor-like RCC1 family protein